MQWASPPEVAQTRSGWADENAAWAPDSALPGNAFAGVPDAFSNGLVLARGPVWWRRLVSFRP
jgi:hypothetical protein